MKLILTTALMVLYLVNPSRAEGTDELARKIESIQLDSGIIEQTDKDHNDFVSVSLSIDKNGQVVVHELNYSNETLKNLLIEELNELQISSIKNSEKVYNYKFSFEFI